MISVSSIFHRKVLTLNLLHMKYALEVARVGSLGKASDKLLVAAPNISRAIKELEGDLGIVIFDRSSKGMDLTPEGEKFVGFARDILTQMNQMERYFKDGTPQKRRFSISVPRASYIAEAFAEFSRTLDEEPVEIFYKETNAQRTIRNLTDNDYKLGIIRYAENYEGYFLSMLEEKGFCHELVTEFSYVVIMSRDNPLADRENIGFDDLTKGIEIAHADPYVPSMPLSKVVKEELPDNIERRIFIYERASQFDLLSRNPETFMWVSPVPRHLLDRYQLVQKCCTENKKKYRDVLVYKKGYQLSPMDKRFIRSLTEARDKYL